MEPSGVNPQHEREAYESIMRAIFVGGADWEVEKVLAELRSALNITDDVHKAIRSRTGSDPELKALKAELKGARRAPQQHMGGVASDLVHGLGQDLPQMGPLMGRGGVTPLTRAPPGSQALPPGSHRQAPSYVGSLAPTRVSSRAAPGTVNLDALFHTGLPGMASAHGAGTRTPPARAVAGLASRSSGGVSSLARGSVQRTVSGADSQSGKRTKLSKHQQQQMLSTAVPPGLDISKSNLQGLVIEKRETEHDEWVRGVVAHTKQMTSGQQCQIVYGLDTIAPTWQLDVFLRKNQAGVTWRFVLPAERLKRDWPQIRPPGVVVRPPAPSLKKRKRMSGDAGDAGLHYALLPMGPAPPFEARTLATAISAAEATGSWAELNQMVAYIQSQRAKVVYELAQVSLEEQLKDSKGPDAAELQLQMLLSQCRAKQDKIRQQLLVMA